MTRWYYVYILTNRNHTVLYTGVTNNLPRRVQEHREGRIAGFTRDYQVSKLVYFEAFEDVRQAIQREKQLKGGSRRRKLDLVSSGNPEWKELYDEIVSDE